jgi:hypothetical protein
MRFESDRRGLVHQSLTGHLPLSILLFDGCAFAEVTSVNYSDQRPPVEGGGRLNPYGPLTAGVIGVVLFLGLFSSIAAARTVHRTARTHLRLSATRTAQGTITIKGVFTSPDQHCLSGRRFRLYSRHGYWLLFGTVLAYGGPGGGGLAGSDPFGADGFGPGLNDHLDHMHPVSTFGHSPSIWRAVWPGGAKVTVTQSGSPQHPSDPNMPFKYTSTVAAATGLIIYTFSHGGLGNGPNATSFPGHRIWKTTYRQGKDRVVLRCRPSGHVEHRIPVSQLSSP